MVEDSEPIVIVPGLEGDDESQTGEVSDASPPVLASDLLPDHLVVLPNSRRPFFPGMFLPVTLTDKSTQAVKLAEERYGGHIGIIVAREDLDDGESGPPRFDHLYRYGVAARVIKSQELPGGSGVQSFMQVLKRFRIKTEVAETPHLIAEVEYLEDEITEMDQEFRATILAVVAETKALFDQNPSYGQELKLVIDRFSSEQPGMLADFTAALTSGSSRGEIQEILETLNVHQRLLKTLLLLKKERSLVSLRNKISKQIEERISEKQREFFLREQLKEIKKELGMEEEPEALLRREFEERLKGKTVPEHAQKVIDEELDRITQIDTRSPEFATHRNYLDWLTAVPWGVRSRRRASLKRARKTLDRDHFGMEDVKERILEFIAVRTLKPDAKGGILCLAGPPGVGKTSIGKAVAEALGRKFFRFSVGGMRDEAEIKGHRRTYIGAMPGKIIQALKHCETQDPVLMIDEIDKLAKSYQGDPAAALLEVLDPEQNATFLDHYLDVRVDLSDILFVCTANQLDTIPRPLLDRMEVIRVPGYLDVEKVQIARRYLLPRQRAKHGLKAEDLAVSRTALESTVAQYARESGVRGLEKAMARLCRKAALKRAEGHEGQIRVNRTNLERFLGKPPMDDQELGGKRKPGIVRGLAWTAMGGATLQIEATAVPTQGKGRLKTTGKLGEVMQESVAIAYTWALAHAVEAGGSPDFFETHDIHIHVPAGATPKDGPSAGIAMGTALVSLASGRPVREGLAMTGELSLTGRVLPVGGIREKSMAAHRMGIKEILLPERNHRDVDELPRSLTRDLIFNTMEEMGDVWRLALEPAEATQAPG